MKKIILALSALSLVGAGCNNDQQLLIQKQQTQIDQLTSSLAKTNSALEQDAEKSQNKEKKSMDTNTVIPTKEVATKNKQPVINEKLKTQINYFGYLLSEYGKTELACKITGGYNYFKLFGDEQTKNEAETNYSQYSAECFKYTIHRKTIVGVTAEPELANLHEKMIDIAYELEKFGRYVVLEKGYDSRIDLYEQNIDRWIVAANEELLKIKQGQ